jgi:beta-1,4-mannosyltransferase
VIVHSERAREACLQMFGTPASRYRVIPHGDLSRALPPPLPRAEAKAELGLDETPTLLAFGRLAPYKGIDELLAAWQRTRAPWRLVIAGKPRDDTYRRHLSALVEATDRCSCQLDWLDDHRLSQWIGAADAVICNYRDILTSGAAMLPRALGVPLLLPARAQTVDLDEPDPRVLRFDDLGEELDALLAKALAVGCSHGEACAWRAAHDWKHVASAHADIYQQVLS